MAKIKNYEQFIVDIADKNFKPYVKRFQELAGLRPLGQTSPATYLIEVTVDFGDSLQEHKTIQNFKKTTNRYYYHPEETNPPVKAHYHVIPSKGKKVSRKKFNEIRDKKENRNKDNEGSISIKVIQM